MSRRVTNFFPPQIRREKAAGNAEEQAKELDKDPVLAVGDENDLEKVIIFPLRGHSQSFDRFLGSSIAPLISFL